MVDIQKSKSENAKIKYKYFYWLKEAIGYQPSTIEKKESSISAFEQFIQHRSFKVFNDRVAVAFKNHLINKKTQNGSYLSVITINGDLMDVKEFLLWLLREPGFKKSINPSDIEYLNLDKNTIRSIQTQEPTLIIPTLEDCIRLMDSIKEKDDIADRDRAIISFLLCSGVRIKTLITLPLKAFDEDKLIIDQNPQFGVHTKFGIRNRSKLIIHDNRLLPPILNHVKYLKHEKHFTPDDPLFPKTVCRYKPGTNSKPQKHLEPEFWRSTSSPVRMLRKRAKVAGLPFFPVHTYRHLAVILAIDMAREPKEVKAVSQNFGHKKVITTMFSYYRLSDPEKFKILERLDNKRDENMDISDDMVKIKEMLQMLMERKND